MEFAVTELTPLTEPAPRFLFDRGWSLRWARTEAAMEMGLGMELEMAFMVRFMLGLVMELEGRMDAV